MAKSRKLPPLPGQDASWKEQAAYFEQHSPEELEAAGFWRPLTEEEANEAELERQTMETEVLKRRKTKQFNFRLEVDELARFEALAEHLHIPPSTLARAWILQRLDQETKTAM